MNYAGPPQPIAVAAYPFNGSQIQQVPHIGLGRNLSSFRFAPGSHLASSAPQHAIISPLAQNRDVVEFRHLNPYIAVAIILLYFQLEPDAGVGVAGNCILILEHYIPINGAVRIQIFWSRGKHLTLSQICNSFIMPLPVAVVKKLDGHGGIERCVEIIPGARCPYPAAIAGTTNLYGTTPAAFPDSPFPPE